MLDTAMALRGPRVILLCRIWFAAPGQEQQAGYHDHVRVLDMSPGRRVKLVEFGVGPELPDLLRTAAGEGDLGSPLQRLLA